MAKERSPERKLEISQNLFTSPAAVPFMEIKRWIARRRKSKVQPPEASGACAHNSHG